MLTQSWSRPWDLDLRRGEAKWRAGDNGNAGALQHDVGPQPDIGDRAAVVGRAELLHQGRFRTTIDTVEHMHLHAVLHRDQRTEQADRPGPDDQHRLRIPESAPPDALRSAVEGGSWDMPGRYGQVSGSWLALHR